MNNLNDGLAWGLFPLYFAAAGLSTALFLLLVKNHDWAQQDRLSTTE